MTQTITSAKTSVRMVPALFKQGNVSNIGPRNVDFGGGKYEDGTEYLKARGVTNYVWDPYNRSQEHNAKVLFDLFRDAPDTATLANVLNVIEKREDRIAVLTSLKHIVKKGGYIFISCYRGKIGKAPGKTSKGWQENRPLSSYYRDEIQEVFGGYLMASSMSMIVVRNA